MPTGIYKRTKSVWNKGLPKEEQPKFGKKHSAETKKKMSEKAKGRIFTEEHKKKLSEENKKNPRRYWLGKHLSEEHIEKNRKGHLGKKWTAEQRKKSNLSGEKSHNWKGGITPINQKIRGSLEYKLWQDSVWAIDGYICQKCSENRVSKLVAHHIKNFAQYLELRFALDNGITFCRDCHKLFHRIYRYKNNTKGQINEFLTKTK